MITLSICICTYKRPHLLSDLCLQIDKQVINKDTTEIIVVDNDPAHSAKDILTSLQSSLNTPLIFTHEAVANIASARNKAISMARGEWVLCIDDDETPDNNWISGMLNAQQHYQADAVFAPVIPSYLPSTPQWIVDGHFFDRPRYPTGTEISVNDARTGNLLINKSLLADIDGPFDTKFGRTGAEDTMLFRILKQKGARFIWCDEASVHEIVPDQRANLNWLLKRSYRLGQTYILTEMAMLSGKKRWYRGCYLFCRSLAQFGIALTLTLCFSFNRIIAIRWLRITASQCGKISALFGHQYFEYGN